MNEDYKRFEFKNLNEEFFVKNKEEAKTYCNNALEKNLSDIQINEIIDIAMKYELMGVLLKAFLSKADTMYDRMEFKSAFTYYYNALKVCNILGQEEKKAYIFNRLGLCKIKHLDYHEGLPYFTSSYYYSIRYNDRDIEKKSLYNMAQCYKCLGKYDDSIAQLNNLSKLCEEDMDAQYDISALIVKAICLVGKGQNSSAIELYEDLINKISEPFDNNLGYIYNNLACIYLNMAEYKKALDNFNKAHLIRQVTNDDNLSHTIIDKSQVFIKQNMFEIALPLLEEGINLTKQSKDYTYTLNAYYLLEEIYSKMNDLAKLREIYLEMLNLIDKRNRKDEILMIYVKLSALSLKNGDLDDCDNYLSTAQNIKI